MKVEIAVANETVSVTSPYNLQFISAARKLNGAWVNGQWRFHAADLDRVRDLCLDIYGTDGDVPADLCTIRVEIGDQSIWHGPVSFEGRVIARAWGRDSGAHLGEGIVLLDGRIMSGGSVKNWYTIVKNLTVLIHDFPRAKAESLGLAIEATPKTINREVLLSERERLVACIAEIDALLAEEVRS